jgi:hypothetical protein
LLQGAFFGEFPPETVLISSSVSSRGVCVFILTLLG